MRSTPCSGCPSSAGIMYSAVGRQRPRAAQAGPGRRAKRRGAAGAGVARGIPFSSCIWVGAVAPAQHLAQSSSGRCPGPRSSKSMDELFAPPEPGRLRPGIRRSRSRRLAPAAQTALIASADRDERLYLRARLALAEPDPGRRGRTAAAQALELARGKQYDVALRGLPLPDMTAWALLRQLRQGKRPIAHVAMTKAQVRCRSGARGWRGAGLPKRASAALAKRVRACGRGRAARDHASAGAVEPDLARSSGRRDFWRPRLGPACSPAAAARRAAVRPAARRTAARRSGRASPWRC